MTDNPNPSVVNDASGNNYGGIGSGAGQAQMQYLENLQRLAMRAGPGPMRGDQYAPGGSDVNVGQVSGSIIGSQPIFAAGNLIPFAMLDEMRQSQLEAEKDYYKNFKTYLDKPLSNITAKLDNPWAQPEFNTKIMQITDQMLESYASKFGGNYGQAYIALQNDKNYHRTLEGFAQYANIYNNVYKEAIDTLAKKDDPENYYVSDDQVAAINKFLHSHDQLENLSIEQLGKNAEEFSAKMSVFKLAEAVTSGVKEDVRSYFEQNPNANLSNDEQEAWVKTKITGDKDQAKNIIDTAVKANPWLKKDPDQLALFSQEVKNRVKYGVEQEVQMIKKENADRDMELKKYGIKTDTEGNIQFASKPSALTGNVGVNAVNYPISKTVVPTVSNMQVYVRDSSGSIKRVTLPNSYDMLPTSEYDLVDEGMPVVRGRYIEGKVNFVGEEPYTPSNERALVAGGKLKGTYSLGEGKSTAQAVPVKAVDMNGNVVELFGEMTILAPYQSMKGQVESIPYMSYVHEKVDAVTYPNGPRRDFGSTNNATASPELFKDEPIDVPDHADMDFIKNDPLIRYRMDGNVKTGKEIWDLYNKKKK